VQARQGAGRTPTGEAFDDERISADLVGSIDYSSTQAKSQQWNWGSGKMTTTRQRQSLISGCVAVCVGLVAPSGVASAQSDPVASFYKGRTVYAVVGSGPGSSFELYTRMATRYLGHHIPGNPTVVLQQMVGAGGLKALNYVYSVAPKDGSVIGMLNPTNTIEPLIDPKRSTFDPRKFNWLGSLNTEVSTCGFWAKDIKTFDDLKKREIVAGATGFSGPKIEARVLKELIGINFKVVDGYSGLPAMGLAAERGELDGHCGFLVSYMKTSTWDAYKAGTFSVPLQLGLSKHPDLPDVPNAYDLLKSEPDRQLFKLIMGPWTYGRGMVAPPGAPADRVAALRAAFQGMVADPVFLNETKQINMEIQPLEPAVIDKLLDEIFRTPPAVVERAQVLLSVGER
jgi:tripartite-type tricarboxylate transporter receptor subunit TctC